MNYSTSVILPNYNGKSLLRSNLPALIASLKEAGEAYEIVVVDDCSADASVAFLQENYPQIRIIVNDQNYGFASTCNVGIAAAKGEYTCIVNTDVQFSKHYFNNILKVLRQSGAFAVLGDIHNSIDGHLDTTRAAGEITFKRGLLRFITASDLNINRMGWRSGDQFLSLGCCFVARTIELKKLRGFNEIFSPFYWEDTDLFMRALKAGLKVEYCYDCEVVHYASGTISKTRTNNKRRLISQRNKFLFTWIHMTTTREKFLHAWYLVYSVALRWLVFDWKFYVSLYTATIRYHRHRNKLWSIIPSTSKTKQES